MVFELLNKRTGLNLKYALERWAKFQHLPETFKYFMFNFQIIFLFF